MSQSQPGASAEPAGSAKPTSYLAAIQAASSDPARLEQLYQSARQSRTAAQFQADLLASYEAGPANLLYGAWYHRFEHAADERVLRHSVNWRLAVPLSVGLALALWLLSNPSWTLARGIPYLAVLWAPITAVFIIAFLALAGRRGYWLALASGLALALIAAYVLAVAPRQGPDSQQTYLTLMLAHIPVLAWGAIGLALLGWGSVAKDRFVFLWKSIEVMGTAGVAAIAGGIFVGLTYGLFQALGVELPDIVLRLLIAGGAGLIPVLAVATVYDVTVSPAEQELGRGFGRILSVLMQALLPLTLIVLVIYVCFIPFNFWQPFANRNVLIVYNVLLFAIMGLLIGVTPASVEGLAPRYQRALRAGIRLLASLVVLVSVYALAAVVYRTAQDSLTMNRLTVIGWNAINIGILALLLTRQLRAGRDGWVPALQATFRVGTVAYVAWALVLLLALPWLF